MLLTRYPNRIWHIKELENQPLPCYFRSNMRRVWTNDPAISL